MRDENENNCIPDIYSPKLPNIIVFFIFVGNRLAILIKLLEYILALKSFHNLYSNSFFI